MKNTFPKIVAFIALFSILLGAIGTGILVLTSGSSNTQINNNLNQEQLKDLLKSFSGSNILTGTTSLTLTGNETGTGK